MTNPTNANPALGSVLPGYDPTGHQTGIALQFGTPVQDATTGVWYAPLIATVGNANANGQTTMSASAPVVIASDQSAVAVKGSATGAAVPAQAFYIGIRDFAGNLDGIQTAGLIGNSGAGIDAMLPAGTYGYIGSGIADMLRAPNVQKNVAAIAITAATPSTVWTPTSGKKFRLMGFALSLTVAGSIILKDNVTEFLRTPTVAAAGFFVAPPMGNGYVSTAANNTLKLDVTASGSVSGYIFGTEE